MTTLTYSGTLVVMSCYCGIRMAVPSELEGWARRTGGGIYCPVGHNFVFTDPENKRLKQQLEQARNFRARETARADQAEASRRAMKGVVTRMRKATLAGECPICHQTLRDLRRHVTRQHPDEHVDLPDEALA